MSHVSFVARHCLRDSSSTIKVNAIKVLQELGRVLYQSLSLDNESSLLSTVCDFWLRLLEGDLIVILQSKEPLESKARSAACDCLSDVGASVFEELRFDKRILIMTILLALVNDEDSYVRVGK